MKEAFSVKFHAENLFLLKIKHKQDPGCPNEKYDAIFKYILVKK